jgi:hypothetical protein
MAGHQNDFWMQWSQVVANAWCDEGFKRSLLADPAAVLREHGITFPDGVKPRVVEDAPGVAEDTPGVMSLVLPAKPASEELSDEELSVVGAAGCGGCRGCGACRRCRDV